MAVFQLIIASVGFVIIWLAMQNLSGQEFHFRKYILIGLSLFGIGFSANGFHAMWVEDGDYWDLIYKPSWGVIFVALPLIWVSIEILILSKAVLTTVEDEKQKLPQRLIYYGWILMIFTLIFLIIERNLYSNSIIYLVPATLALLLMAIAIYIDPFSIIPQTVGGEYLMISNRDSGLPILIHNFHEIDQSKETSQSFLFSGAMKGILTLMDEVTGRSEIPEHFGYANYNIMIEKSDTYIAYFICLNSVSAVRVILNDILRKIEHMNLDSTKMHDSEIQKMHELVVEELEFAT